MYPQSPTKPFLFMFLIFMTQVANSAPDNTNLVYKGCAQQTLQDPNGVYSSALSAIFGTLIQQSSKAKFFKTTSGSGSATISGLFQCRGDLTNVECYNCVSRLPILMDKLCGKTVAARLQLLGCYMLYEVAGYAQISGMEMLFKTCGSSNSGGMGFEEKRDAAFSALESGIGSGNNNNNNNNGGGYYYATSYESLYVLGQCQGDIGSGDCGECVKSAVQRAGVECGSSTSGQIYLHKCFVSYSYYPNGVPNPKKSSSSGTSSDSSYSSSSSSSDSSYYSPSSSSSSGTNSNTGKTVAIILGGAAGVGFLVIFVLFAKNAAKKHDDY